MSTAKEVITRSYKAILSTKHEVKIDPNEIEDVLRGAGNGNLIQVRQGLINPSYLVAIVEDKERKDLFLEDTKYDGSRRSGGMKPLQDILSKSAPALPAPRAQ